MSMIGKELVPLRVEGGGGLKLTTDMRIISIMIFLITQLKMVVEHAHFGWMGRWFGVLGREGERSIILEGNTGRVHVSM